ncbi:MAG: hypothetical protein M1828_005155 [Chrysothrix sp. TS-e1954]|nr:MAG: hypothetical protein M1828_005155 [Chrysothrix sp. TS-e1954]
MDNNDYATYLLPRVPEATVIKKFASINKDASRSIPGLILHRSHELLWSDGQWSKQLFDPKKFHFVCVSKRKSANNDEPPTLKNGRWVGMCTWVGPLSQEEYTHSDASDSSDDETEEPETFWHAGRVYLRPAHRNPSAFTSMVEGCVTFIRNFTIDHLGASSGHCRVRMHTTLSPNSSMGPLYEATGAHQIDYLTLHESLRANYTLQDVSDDAFSKSDYATRDRPLLEWLRAPWLGIDLLLANSHNLKAGKFQDGLYRRHRHYGSTYATRVLGRQIFQTIEPENIQAIHSTRFKDYVLPDRRKQLRPIAGNGIFTTDGAEWQHSRAMLRPNFTKDHINDVDMLEKHVTRMIELIKLQNGATFDLLNIALMFTMDTATELLFGESANTLLGASNQNEGVQAFNHFANTVEEEIVTRIRSWRGLLGGFSNRKEFAELLQKVYDFADGYVDRAVQAQADEKAHITKEDSPSDTKPRYTLLQELVASTTDKRRIRFELLNIFFAGRNTTAALLSNIFWILARRPDILARLRSEISTHLPNNQAPSIAQLRDLEYLRWTINESLRLHPPAGLTTRKAAADTVLPRGGGVDGTAPLHVPAGASVTVSIHALHRDEALWGADALEFKPERWGSSPPARDWGFLPFLRGPRGCLGQRLALNEAGYVVVRLVQAFGRVEVGVMEGGGGRVGDEWVESVSLSAHHRDGTRVVMV